MLCSNAPRRTNQPEFNVTKRLAHDESRAAVRHQDAHDVKFAKRVPQSLPPWQLLEIQTLKLPIGVTPEFLCHELRDLFLPRL